MGPILGGVLASPASKYDAFAGVQFFRDFPFFLPSAVGAVIGLVGFALGCCFLQESKVAGASSVPEKDGVRNSETGESQPEEEGGDVEMQLLGEGTDSSCQTATASASPNDSKTREQEEGRDPGRSRCASKAWCSKSIMQTCGVYACISYAFIAADEV